MKSSFENLPFMLYADDRGRVYEHPYYRMAGFSGSAPRTLKEEDLIPVPAFSKLFYIPQCPPIGLDPCTGEYKTVTEVKTDGSVSTCRAVAVFLEPGFVRTHLPALDYSHKDYTLPMWGYTAVGFRADQYMAAAIRVEYNHKWDPANYDDRDLVPAIERFKKEHGSGALAQHLIGCATNNHCFAAKNLFLRRWEAPLPTSQRCNAACLGCLSLQPASSCEASHRRISFVPSKHEIVALAVRHLNEAPEAIVSFGQGCEGEPLTESPLISETIREIRCLTGKGTINLNTNGSWPDRVATIAESGLDTIRISLNSARSALYKAYYRPKGYDFEDVVASIELSQKLGLYTMINYLVFPGITDQEEEIIALRDLIDRTGVSFIHLKNLCIDPELYLRKMPRSGSMQIGMRPMVARLLEEFPDVELGYFNQPAGDS